MHSISRCSRLFVLSLIILLLSGCFSFGGRDKAAEAEAPQFYVVETNRGASAPAFIGQRVLLIKPVRVVQNFRGAELMFRVDETHYQPQSAHQLIIDPQTLFTGQLQRWLNQSGLFSQVTTDASVPADLVLEAAVTRLYGDARQAYAPTAVLEMQFFMTRAETEQTVFQTGFRVDADIDVVSPTQVVTGWQNGLEEILATLEQDLSAYFSKAGTP